MSKLKISEGFSYKGYQFGWHKGRLFRLPKKITVTEQSKKRKYIRTYPLKELPLIKLSISGLGYRLITDKKSVIQVRSMTEPMKKVLEIFDCQECK